MDEPNATNGAGARKLIFSSDHLPKHLSDTARFNLFCDIFAERYGACDFARVQDRPFSAVYEFMHLKEIGLGRASSTVLRWARNAKHLSADTRGDFMVTFNCNASPLAMRQRDRETVVGSQQWTLFTNAEAAVAEAASEMRVMGINLPRQRLLERVADAEDLALAQFSDSAAARHFRRYIQFLMDGGVDEELGLDTHIETTLLDLVALALGAEGESAEIARMRGLRRARLREITAAIRAGFTDPTFSLDRVAATAGVSPRYVQELLHESGRSFSERVLELRLQKARAMLADSRFDRLRIAEIALDCGFNEISNFNRHFRRRFGVTPRYARWS
ncbi:MAG: AraC family transcriptional regulator [Methyloceanibacter sp.]|uniref:AraC family transcriptional regulator n=1 Tax=Methyloceanibacter sp. TaxID=1965321 RepID=UPI003D6CE3E5